MPIATLLALAVVSQPANRMALLVGVTRPPFEAPVNDCAVVREALLRRGWSDREIHTLAGPSSGRDVIAFLRMQSAGMQAWQGGDVLLFVSGRSTPRRSDLMPMLEVSDGTLALDQVLDAVIRPPRVRLAVVADTGHANLLAGRLPPLSATLTPELDWNQTTGARAAGTVVHQGRTMDVGVLSYVAAREIPYAESLRDLADRINRYKASGSMSAIWSDLQRVKVIGAGFWPLPGATLRPRRASNLSQQW